MCARVHTLTYSYLNVCGGRIKRGVWRGLGTTFLHYTRENSGGHSSKLQQDIGHFDVDKGDFKLEAEKFRKSQTCASQWKERIRSLFRLARIKPLEYNRIDTFIYNPSFVKNGRYWTLSKKLIVQGMFTVNGIEHVNQQN